MKYEIIFTAMYWQKKFSFKRFGHANEALNIFNATRIFPSREENFKLPYGLFIWSIRKILFRHEIIVRIWDSGCSERGKEGKVVLS